MTNTDAQIARIQSCLPDLKAARKVLFEMGPLDRVVADYAIENGLRLPGQFPIVHLATMPYASCWACYTMAALMCRTGTPSPSFATAFDTAWLEAPDGITFLAEGYAATKGACLDLRLEPESYGISRWRLCVGQDLNDYFHASSQSYPVDDLVDSIRQDTCWSDRSAWAMLAQPIAPYNALSYLAVGDEPNRWSDVMFAGWSLGQRYAEAYIVRDAFGEAFPSHKFNIETMFRDAFEYMIIDHKNDMATRHLQALLIEATGVREQHRMQLQNSALELMQRIEITEQDHHEDAETLYIQWESLEANIRYLSTLPWSNLI